MGSWTFKIHSNYTEGIMMAKERLCQLDGWLLCMRVEKQAGAEEAEVEARVSGKREEFCR